MAKSTALANRDKMASFMAQMKGRIEAVLPKHLTPERMAQIVLVEASRTPKLAECTTESLAACVMLASELGLEPSGPLGKMYLIPRKNTRRGVMECTALIGYKGLADLARRSGDVARLNAGVVYQWELNEGVFKATLEPPEIRHSWSPIPAKERTDDNIALAYATALLTDGSPVQVILSRADIEARMKRSASGQNGPWGTDYAAMSRKTALRALLSGGLVPLSAEPPPVGDRKLMPGERLTRAVLSEREENIAPEPVTKQPPPNDLGSLVDLPAQEAEYVPTKFEALQARVTDAKEGDTEAARDCIDKACANACEAGKIPEGVHYDKMTDAQVETLSGYVDKAMG